MSLKVIILAAGQGTRMCSSIPKVLHELAAKPLLQWVIDVAESVNPESVIVVYGHGGELVRKRVHADNLQWIEQTELLGTGHGVEQTMSLINDSDRVLILCGDVPLISTQTLQVFIDDTPKDALGLITANVSEPFGFGRIVRDEKGHIVAIIEEKDAADDVKQICEINTGIMLIPAADLKKWLARLENNNVQAEYYLTDIIAMAVADDVSIFTSNAAYEEEILGVNNRVQLAELESFYQTQVAQALMLKGVSLRDPARFDLRGELYCGEDVTIDVNVIIEGEVSIGSGTTIGPNVILKNVTIGDNTKILANSMIEDSEIANGCIIGPYARLRPGTKLKNNVKIGNFVETKKAIVGEGSKIPHLSYIGDADVGTKVNIGAGVITANYDGANKSKTVIGDRVFIGCDSQLIAPVNIGDDAFIGCGSSISKNAPAGKLTLSRAKQVTINKWVAPKKGK